MNEQYHTECAKCMALTLHMMPGTPGEGRIDGPEEGDNLLGGFYRQLNELREDAKVKELLIHGQFGLLVPEDTHIFAYERSLDGRRLSIVANWSPDNVECCMHTDLSEGVILAAVYGDTHPSEKMLLRPYEAFAVLI